MTTAAQTTEAHPLVTVLAPRRKSWMAPVEEIVQLPAIDRTHSDREGREDRFGDWTSVEGPGFVDAVDEALLDAIESSRDIGPSPSTRAHFTPLSHIAHHNSGLEAQGSIGNGAYAYLQASWIAFDIEHIDAYGSPYPDHPTISVRVVRERYSTDRDAGADVYRTVRYVATVQGADGVTTIGGYDTMGQAVRSLLAHYWGPTS